MPPRSDRKAHEFTLLEIYGGSHLSLERNRNEQVHSPTNLTTAVEVDSEILTVLRTEKTAGDDTAYFHIPTECGVHITGVGLYIFIIYLPNAIQNFI